MKAERRRGEGERRRDPTRIGDAPDRRRLGRGVGGPRGSHHFRFPLFYILLALLLILGINYLAGQQGRKAIPYSELKARIAAGEVKEVSIGANQIQATPVDSLARGRIPVVWTAVRVQDDPTLIPLLEANGVQYQGVTTGWLGSAAAWLLPLGLLAVFWVWMIRRMNPAQGVMTVGKNRARIVGEEGTGVSFAQVAGADEAKDELVEVVDFLKTPEKFVRLGAKIPKGVLLIGPPGTGKTLLARAVAGEANVTFFSISGSEFVEMFVGVGAARVRDLFEQAKASAPCIVFIDELDALGKARGVGGVMGGHDEREQTLNQLLVEMDGFDPRIGVIIMAATNRPEILDPALLRPGRFDRQILVDRPDRVGREAILRVHASGIKLGQDVDLKEIAQRTPGFVGADLANLLNEAALLAARRDKSAVSMEEIDEAIDRVLAGLEKKNRLINKEERKIVAYHEAGHAIVAERVEYADPVHKISIIPRGIAALGFTQQTPTDDRYLLQRRELLDRLCVLLGGRTAEELAFGEISTGASNDLERASDIARRMVLEFGMSDVVGLAHMVHQRNPMLADPHEILHLEEGRSYSEATATAVDGEVRRILNDAHDRAREILEKDRTVLDDVAARLLEKEVVDRAELREIMGKPPIPENEEEGPVTGLRGAEGEAGVPAPELPRPEGEEERPGPDLPHPEAAD
jgi:cell division protease FtsH